MVIQLNGLLSGKELLIWFTVRGFLEVLSVYVFASFSFGFEDGISDLIYL